MRSNLRQFPRKWFVRCHPREVWLSRKVGKQRFRTSLTSNKLGIQSKSDLQVQCQYDNPSSRLTRMDLLWMINLRIQEISTLITLWWSIISMDQNWVGPTYSSWKRWIHLILMMMMRVQIFFPSKPSSRESSWQPLLGRLCLFSLLFFTRSQHLLIHPTGHIWMNSDHSPKHSRNWNLSRDHYIWISWVNLLGFRMVNLISWFWWNPILVSCLRMIGWVSCVI